MSYIPLKLDACIRNLYTNLVTNSEVSKGSSMGGSRKKFRGGGGEPNTVGIKVAQLNVLLELQLKTSLVMSQIPA